MKEIENLYKKLIANQDSSEHTLNINEQIRSKLHKTILDNLKKLRKRQQKTDFISETYEKIDYEIRTLLLKEIQVILDEYILAKEQGTLKNWNAMYGEIEHYIKNFFYYRMDGQYEAKKKTLKDYKILDEELLST